MRDISIDGLKALFAQETDEVFVFAVVLSHPNWSAPAYLVADQTDMVFGADTYTAFPFTVSLPAQQEGSIPVVQLKADNVERLYIDEFRNQLEPPSAEVSVFRRSFDGTNTRETAVMDLKVTSLSYTVTSLTLTLSLDADYLNEPASKDRFLPSNSPGLFV